MIRCPQCGEDERITGKETGGEVLLSCAACGHEWPRGPRTCNTCGQPGLIVYGQGLWANPRGNQSALVGRREVWLCPRCDAAVISATGDTGVVPPDYRSRAMALAQDGPRPTPLAQDGRRPTPTPNRPAAKGTVAPIRSAGPERQPQRASRPPQVPTVREALEKSQGELGLQIDIATVLLLGRWLGPSQRLDRIDTGPEAWAQWVAQNFSGRNRERAAQTTRAILEHWQAEGWIGSAG